MFLIDAHLDISTNAIEWNRDYRMSVDDIRKSEAGMTDKIDRGKGTVSLPELRKGQIGLVVATQLARFNQNNGSLPGAGWKGFDPTIGAIVGTDHIAVAVARQPEAVPPIAGAYVGPPGATLDVGVWVTDITQENRHHA
jgi:hypothetical protein